MNTSLTCMQQIKPIALSSTFSLELRNPIYFTNKITIFSIKADIKKVYIKQECKAYNTLLKNNFVRSC